VIKRDPKATKERIIKAAISVFSQGDFNEATMRDIARRSGVSQANIYQHYTSKESLLFSIIDDETMQMKRALVEHLKGIQGARNKLRKVTWFYLDFRQQHRQLTWLETISLNTKAWSEAKDTWDHSMQVSGVFRDILAQGKRSGEVREDVDIRLAGHLYFGGLRNVISFWLLGKQYRDLTGEVANKLTDFIWEAVRTRPEQPQCPFQNGNGEVPKTGDTAITTAKRNKK
jgi:TetR/AcrR family transcriptional regulator, fatty acid metabolism regulator protein